MTDYVETVAMHEATWGTFLEPDTGLIDVENLHEVLGIPIQSGYQADLKSLAGRNRIFDQIAAQIGAVDLGYEDQCSLEHYFDLFNRVQGSHDELYRLVEVGVFMGGSASVLAGCVEPFGLELDLIDVNRAYLQFTYERLRRIFPRAVPRIRLFHGDLPTYVRSELGTDTPTRALVHHDGAHSFGQVVKDLSSLYFAKDRVHGLAIHDTYLRGDVKHLNFVDAAVYAMFGVEVKSEPLGANHSPDVPMANPNQWDGNYFLPGQSEGMYIPFTDLEFKYPHHSMGLESFLPVKANPAP